MDWIKESLFGDLKRMDARQDACVFIAGHTLYVFNQMPRLLFISLLVLCGYYSRAAFSFFGKPGDINDGWIRSGDTTCEQTHENKQLATFVLIFIRENRTCTITHLALYTRLLVFYQVLNFGMIVSSALMIWKGLMVVTGSESPIVVVLSGSMEPAFYRGDLLFLTNYHSDPVQAGEILVFKIKDRDIPIVHRIIKIHENSTGELKILTKGDNNYGDDREGHIYAPGQNWVTRDDIIGRARGFLPYVGMVTILMNDYPMLKYALLGGLGLFVFLHRE